MSSRNRKKITTRKKLQPKEVDIQEAISILTFPELKVDMDQIKEQIKTQKQDNLDPLDRYLCEDCNIYLLYKNVNRHNGTKCHKLKEKTQ